jgi:cytochrome c peroxidase
MAWNNNEFFWDGRAHLLRAQALMPIQDPLEMNETLTNVIDKLETIPDYIERFDEVFGSPVINEFRISLALEQFMNTIASNKSKYDKVQLGKATFTASEERGRMLFFNQFNPVNPNLSGANCAHCHGGANFENNDYMNNGLDIDADMVDMGRGEVINNDLYRGTFKVPSLRNIELTPPYMHDGRFDTLEEVVDHYNNGIKISSTLNSTLASVQNNGGFQLSEQDKVDLIVFLKTLTDYELINNPKFSDPFN